MGFKMPPISGIIGLVCAGVGLIFQIVGVATTGWVVSKLNIGIVSIESSIGLWKSCSDPGSCSNIDSADWLEACRAFGILGLLVLAGCLVTGLLISVIENDLLPKVAPALGFVAGFFILLEFAIFAGKYPGKSDYNYSFALTIIACVLAIAAGVCFFLAKPKTT